jgi:hypothetical protein
MKGHRFKPRRPKPLPVTKAEKERLRVAADQSAKIKFPAVVRTQEDAPPPLVEDRQCGSCTACCKALAVAEIEKREADTCQYCDMGRGCRIYAVRPTPCIEWQCAWRSGVMGDEERPDKLKVIFDLQETRFGKTLAAWELAHGARDRPKVRAVIDAHLRAGIAVVVIAPSRGGRTAMLPYSQGAAKEYTEGVFAASAMDRTYVKSLDDAEEGPSSVADS